MSDLAERVHAYLRAHTTLNLATAGPEGPWACAVLYVTEGDHLYFTSVATTRHAHHLATTGRAAGTVNDDCTSWLSMKGVQLEGTVARVDDRGERERIVGAYLARFPFAVGLWHGETDPARIAADPAGHDFYRLTPAHLWFTDNEHAPGRREELAVG